MTHQKSTKDYHYVQRESQTQARGTVNVPQSTAASAAGVHVVDSLVQHIRTYGVASGTFGKRGSGQDRHDDDARHSRPITYLLWCKTRKDTVQYTARNGYYPLGYSRWVFGASLLIFQSSQVKITKPRKSSIQVKSNLQRRGACCAERTVPPADSE